jgi:thiosulfate dehydrogenase
MELFQNLIKKLMALVGALFLLMLVVFFGVLYFDRIWKPEAEKPIQEWNPDVLVLSNPEVSEQVKKGYLLLSASSQNMGPLQENPSLRYAGNNLSCTNCHLNGGTQSGAASWIGIGDRFPQFGGRANKTGSLTERINGCMERSMNGKALPEDAPQMKAMLAYMEWLDEGLPKLNSKNFKGYPKIEIPSVAVNLTKGKSIYEKECTLCHGAEGQGVRYNDPKKGYQYPPLWGDDTYNDGAGMHRVLTAAAFIKNNMPYLQARWDNPKLTDEEAYHVAGYINSFSRPQKENTTADYPDKKLKPVSTPYGPWTDSFSPEQHKYGPFPPIIQYYKQTYGIEKTK